MADFQWWGGRDVECMTFGPFSTRHEAVAEGYAYFGSGGFYVIEAKQQPIDVATYLDVDLLIENIGEAIDDNCGDPEGGNDPLFDPNIPQTNSLEAMLKAEIRRWQELHGIVVTPWQFSAVRNEEFIPLGTLPDDEEAAA